MTTREVSDAEIQRFLRPPDVTPEDLRRHADMILTETVPVVRGAALLREAAYSAENWMTARERAKAELERLYAIEAQFNRAQSPTPASVDEGLLAALKEAVDVLDDMTPYENVIDALKVGRAAISRANAARPTGGKEGE